MLAFGRVELDQGWFPFLALGGDMKFLAAAGVFGKTIHRIIRICK
jgi:hypothetical protein